MVNSQLLNNFNSIFIIFSTLACVILSFVFNDFYLNILAFSGILTFGIIHGANDLLLIKAVSEKFNFKTQLLFYVIMVGVFFIFFYNIPVLALITFVLLSSYHFGEQQWTLFLKTEDYLIKPFYFFYGLTIFSLIFYFNLNEVLVIIYDITTLELNEDFFFYLLIISSMLSLLMSFLLYEKIKNQFITQLTLLALLIITFKTCGLIWSFGIYFVFWHSIPSIKEQTIFIYGKAEKDSIKNYFKKAFLYWLLSIIVLIITYYLFRSTQDKLISIFFSFLASITFPHTFVVSKIKKPS
ncbi:Brp/Blh family beta-carotene 15,15'-dioxygenase [Flavobacteriaceae bacterium]|nr:Brp/Blh family beta-carotene 15,15'-dioxygenase [Flavobacteriaceae bacterium]MDB4050945.1 Brp/Blh family beta-carotene 15,15'-dioxygenase [Flavobacteriaceae bacterium]MDB9902299.1 Brp/Blh family beta-carotene 15,15'-dioxygenase [Flavobacteriaceae bacterium]